MTWQPWTLCLLWLSLLWPPDAAAVPPASLAEGEVLIVDKVFDRLAPAMFRRPFQRMPEDGERMYWTDPELPEIRFDSQRTLFGDYIHWIDPETYGQAASLRTRRMAPLSAIVTTERLQAVIRDAAGKADETVGGGFSRVLFPREAGKAQVAQVLADRDSGTAMVVQRPAVSSLLPDPDPVQLSWDDRQILISTRVQRFRKVRGKHMTIRDLGPPVYYSYVGAPVPEGVDPLTYWTRNDGEPMFAALREGFEQIFRAARLPMPASGQWDRASLAVVMVAGRVQRFPGVVIEQGEPVSRLALGKSAIVLVRTSPHE